MWTMAKPVTVFRSRVIGGPGNTASFDANSHLLIFAFFFSRFIASWAMSPPSQWGHLEVGATGQDREYGWLSVDCHVSGITKPGVGHSDPQRPSRTGIDLYYLTFLVVQSKGPTPLQVITVDSALVEVSCRWV
jgi:hypothetical protein